MKELLELLAINAQSRILGSLRRTPGRWIELQISHYRHSGLPTYLSSKLHASRFGNPNPTAAYPIATKVHLWIFLGILSMLPFNLRP